MPGTLNLQIQFTETIDSAPTRQIPFPSPSIAMVGSDVHESTLTLTATEATMPIGSIGTLGLVWIRNDGTQDIRVGCQTGNYTNRIPPGLCMPFFPTGNTVFWRTASGSQPIWFRAYEA